jgi:hypothetical protein
MTVDHFVYRPDEARLTGRAGKDLILLMMDDS